MAAALRAHLNQRYAGVEPFRLICGTAASVGVGLVALDVAQNYRAYWNLLQIYAFRALKNMPGVAGVVAAKNAKLLQELEESVHGHRDLTKFPTLPTEGLSQDTILELMRVMRERELPKWSRGKVSGSIYIASEKHTEFLTRCYGLFAVSNPIHVDLFPSVRKMESEVVRMTANMMSGDAEVCGAMTSGGTESILMSVKAWRDYSRATKPHITEPEIVAPNTAHCAFDKACQYLCVKLVSIEVDENGCVSVAAMRKAITPNTIMLVGSACNYPHGIIDPIPEITALAVEHNLGMHVDCCLGGFVLPFLKKAGGYPIPDFDFRVPGVTSMSADTHKFGQSLKGSSVVLFRNSTIRKYMYFTTTEWPGGLYSSPSLAGSRPGAVIAATWASLLTIGENGFAKQARILADNTQALVEGLNKIDGLFVIGKPVAPIVAFGAKDVNIYAVGDVMSKAGWSLSSLHKPSALHICLTACHDGQIPALLADLKTAVENVRANPNQKGGFAPVYGLAATLPDRTLVSDLLVNFMDVVLKDSK